MKTECCVLGCGSNRFRVPWHIFPKKLELFALWKDAVYSAKIEDQGYDILRRRFVCYRHFKDDDYIMGCKHRRLKANAIPSVAIPCTSDINTAVCMPAVKIEVLENVQPSCSYNMKSGNTTPSLNKKRQLCLLANRMNSSDLTARKAISQACMQKKFQTTRKRLRKAPKLCTSESIQSLISSLSTTQQSFIQMQLKTSKYVLRVVNNNCSTLQNKSSKPRSI